jgi:thiamine biosynthesis lipoprotein
MMDFKKFSLGFVAFFILGSCSKDQSHVLSGFALGTTYTIKYNAPIPVNDLEIQVDSLFFKINRSLSTYLPTSDISKINRGDATVVVDAYFREVFEVSKKINQLTNRYFDPTVGNLVNAYGFGPEKPLNTIQQTQIDSLLQLTGMHKVRINNDGNVVKDHPFIYLDFNAIAKGYTVDLLGELLSQNSVDNYLVEVGGELVARGENRITQKPWTVGIDNPLQKGDNRTYLAVITLTNKAMATSGNYRKYRIDSQTGTRYVHTLNPMTGMPVKSRVLSATVLASSCIEADAMATALMAMPLKMSKKILEQSPDFEAFLVLSSSTNSIETYSTPGFQSLVLN